MFLFKVNSDLFFPGSPHPLEHALYIMYLKGYALKDERHMAVRSLEGSLEYTTDSCLFESFEGRVMRIKIPHHNFQDMYIR